MSESFQHETPAPTPGDDAGPAESGQTERTRTPASSLVVRPTREKRWSRNGCYLGFSLTLLGTVVAKSENGFSGSIIDSICGILILAAAGGGMAAVMGFVFGNMVDVLGDHKVFRPAEVDKALDAVEDNEATQRWGSQPFSPDDPSARKEVDADPPPFKDTDIISSRAPAQRNAAPTDIQPGEPQP